MEHFRNLKKGEETMSKAAGMPNDGNNPQAAAGKSTGKNPLPKGGKGVVKPTPATHGTPSTSGHPK